MLHSCSETSSLFLQHKEEGFHRNISEGTGRPFAIGFIQFLMALFQTSCTGISD